MMTSISASTNTSTCIEVLRKQYQECNHKIEQLTKEIRLCDGWQVEKIKTLNAHLEQACEESKAILQTWDEAIAAMETNNNDATPAEWKEVATLIPSGYRIKNGWFCDRHGRSTKPPVLLTPRESSILTGTIPVKS